MHKNTLHKMDDRIAGANVMTYYEGKALNWHFDRSEYTTPQHYSYKHQILVVLLNICKTSEAQITPTIRVLLRC